MDRFDHRPYQPFNYVFALVMCLFILIDLGVPILWIISLVIETLSKH